ncbi:MAG: radical SAM protein [Candidatus Alcyoniella australis]|nr:radical SAM protein [Candidatus Alcyoniella australis]
MKPLVVLVNPLVGDPYEFTRDKRPLPLGLLGVAAAIQGRCECVLVDQRMTPDWERKLGALLQRGPLMVGMHVMGGSQIRPGIALSRWIKRRCDAPLVWGGAFGSFAPEIVLGEPTVDIVARGEGETVAPALVAALENGSDLRDVQGIAYRNNADVELTSEPPLVELELLPELPYEMLDLRNYDWSAGVNVRDDRLKLQIETSRGCLGRCVFCYNPFVNRSSWRAQSAQRTLERITHLVKDLGAGQLDLIDDSYFEDLQRVSAVAQGMIERGAAVPHLINGGKVGPLLQMSEQELELLARAGCEVIHIGAESGSDRVLQLMGKDSSVEQIRQVNLKLGTAGIAPSFYFMAGMPGESDADLDASMALMIELTRDNPLTKIVASFVFTPYPRTPGYDLALRHGLRPPSDLRAWSRFDSVRTEQGWLSPRMRRRAKRLFFYVIWIDRKVEDLSPSPLVRLVAGLFRIPARRRLEHAWLGLPLEMWIGKLGLGCQRMLARLGRTLRRRVTRTSVGPCETQSVTQRSAVNIGSSMAEDRRAAQ